MPGRSLAFAALLLMCGCAHDAGFHESNYPSQPGSTAGYYPDTYQDPLAGELQ